MIFTNIALVAFSVFGTVFTATSFDAKSNEKSKRKASSKASTKKAKHDHTADSDADSKAVAKAATDSDADSKPAAKAPSTDTVSKTDTAKATDASNTEENSDTTATATKATPLSPSKYSPRKKKIVSSNKPSNKDKATAQTLIFIVDTLCPCLKLLHVWKEDGKGDGYFPYFWTVATEGKIRGKPKESIQSKMQNNFGIENGYYTVAAGTDTIATEFNARTGKSWNRKCFLILVDDPDSMTEENKVELCDKIARFNGNLNKKFNSSEAPVIANSYKIITDLNDTSFYPEQNQPLQHYLRNDDVVTIIKDILCHDETNHSNFAIKHSDTKHHFFKGPIYPSIAKDCLGYSDDTSASVNGSGVTLEEEDDLFA